MGTPRPGYSYNEVKAYALLRFTRMMNISSVGIGVINSSFPCKCTSVSGFYETGLSLYIYMCVCELLLYSHFCIFQILQSNSLQIGFPPVPYLYNNTDKSFSSALPPRDSALPMVSRIITISSYYSSHTSLLTTLLVSSTFDWSIRVLGINNAITRPLLCFPHTSIHSLLILQ